jgi:hypothetical protein
MSNLHKIIPLLPKLDLAELVELEQRVKLLKQTGHAVAAASGGELESDESFVLRAIAELLRGMGLGSVSLPLLQRTVAERLEDGHSFREKVPGLMGFLRQQHPSRVGQHALLSYALELLYHNMLHAGFSLSYRTLMANIHRVPMVLDSHFPGYAKLRLLGCIVDKQRKLSDPVD